MKAYNVVIMIFYKKIRNKIILMIINCIKVTKIKKLSIKNLVVLN